MIHSDKPLICTWRDLYTMFIPLHMHIKADVDRLHDIWKIGAPTPNSRVLLPNEYDPRKRQPGNYEARIVFPTPLAEWIQDVSKARGFPFTKHQALEMLQGHATYE